MIGAVFNAQAVVARFAGFAGDRYPFITAVTSFLANLVTVNSGALFRARRALIAALLDACSAIATYFIGRAGGCYPFVAAVGILLASLVAACSNTLFLSFRTFVLAFFDAGSPVTADLVVGTVRGNEIVAAVAIQLARLVTVASRTLPVSWSTFVLTLLDALAAIAADFIVSAAGRYPFVTADRILLAGFVTIIS